jgi:predicted TPR repeat methyltransferase
MDTIGNLIDKLTIVNIRIWMAEDIKRKKDATDKEVADATKLTNIANQQRNDLIQEIDEKLNYMVETGELQKLYKQGSTKIYGKKEK